MNRKQRRLRDKLFNHLKSNCKVKMVPVSELLKMPCIETPNPMFDIEKFIQSLDDPDFDFRVNEKCCLCDAHISHFRDSHNPYPLNKKDTDRCCSKCSDSVVIYARIQMLKNESESV
jgi:hypothetical protein